MSSYVIICPSYVHHMSRYVPSATISYSNQTLLLLCDISPTDELTRMGPPCCKLPRWAPCSSAGPEMNDYQRAKTDCFMAKACKSISFFQCLFSVKPLVLCSEITKSPSPCPIQAQFDTPMANHWPTILRMFNMKPSFVGGQFVLGVPELSWSNFRTVESCFKTIYIIYV